MDYFSDGMEFFMRTSKGDFILTNTQNTYVRERMDNRYPRELEALYRLDADRLLAGTYTTSELERDLGATVQETGKGTYTIDASTLSGTTIGNGTNAGLGVIGGPCGEAFEMALMEDYYEVLGSPYTVVTDVNTWMSNVRGI